MKKVLFVLIGMTFLLQGCTKEPGSIYGIVTTTGEPLKGINVLLYKDASLLLSTVTYDDGHYEFSELQPGEYTLKVSTAGYQMHYVSVLIETSRQARMDIQLMKGSPDNGVIVLQTDGIMVQQFDLSSGINYWDADDLCYDSQAGGYDDWRLPTEGEIMVLYEKKDIIGNFFEKWYWASDKCCCNFKNGKILYAHSGYDYSYRVRAVRTLYY